MRWDKSSYNYNICNLLKYRFEFSFCLLCINKSIIRCRCGLFRVRIPPTMKCLIAHRSPAWSVQGAGCGKRCTLGMILAAKMVSLNHMVLSLSIWLFCWYKSGVPAWSVKWCECEMTTCQFTWVFIHQVLKTSTWRWWRSWRRQDGPWRKPRKSSRRDTRWTPTPLVYTADLLIVVAVNFCDFPVYYIFSLRNIREYISSIKNLTVFILQ